LRRHIQTRMPEIKTTGHTNYNVGVWTYPTLGESRKDIPRIVLDANISAARRLLKNDNASALDALMQLTKFMSKPDDIITATLGFEQLIEKAVANTAGFGVRFKIESLDTIPPTYNIHTVRIVEPPDFTKPNFALDIMPQIKDPQSRKLLVAA
jgi:hypothetical protein